MGNCTKKRSDKQNLNSPPSVPDLTYIDRQTKTLISVIKQKYFQLPLRKKLRLYKDSCISSFPDNTLLIGGGSDSSNSLTNNLFHISPIERTLNQLPSLPIPFKHGSFLNSPEFIYYIGGICEAQDHDATAAEEGSPLCRFSKRTLIWEMFSCMPKCNVTKFLQRKVATENMTQRISLNQNFGLQLKDLFEPGAFIFRNKIFLVGGKVNRNGELEASNKVLSVVLDEPNFTIAEEKFCLPVALIAPSCCVYRNTGCVAGGFLQNMSQNYSVFLIDFPSNTIRKFEVELEKPPEPRYPVFMDNKGISYVSLPTMILLREDKKIFTFPVPATLKQFEFKSIKNQSLKVNEYVKKVVDLTLNFKTVKPEALDVELSPSELKLAQITVEDEPDFEELKITFTDRDLPELPVHCQCGKLLKDDLIKLGNCSHCKLNNQKLYFCMSCDKLLCFLCATELQRFTLSINPNIQCKEKHFFGLPKGELSKFPQQICINCSHPTKAPYFYCFVCQEALCTSCEAKINSLLYSADIHCAYFHRFVWTLPQPSHSAHRACDVCLCTIKQIGYFYCAACKFMLCLNCVHSRKETNPKNKVFSKACAYQEQPKKLSDSFYKNVFNKGDEPMNFGRFSSKKVACEDLETVRKICVRVDLGPVKEVKAKGKFETSVEEIKKKIIQKPKKPVNNVLGLCSKKNVPSNGSAQSPRLINMPQKTLESSSSESVHKDRFYGKNLSERLAFNPLMVHQSLGEHVKLEKKLPDTDENLTSVKFTEDVLVNEHPARDSKENPLELQNLSFLSGPDSDKHFSEDSEKFSMQNIPQAISGNQAPSQLTLNFSSKEPSIHISQLEPAKNPIFLTPHIRLPSNQFLNVLQADSSFNHVSPNASNKEPSVFSTYGDEPDNSVAPDIKGILATGKLTSLKAKFNLLMNSSRGSESSSEENGKLNLIKAKFDLLKNNNRGFESSSEENSFSGFVDSFKPEGSWTSLISEGKNGGLGGIESKRYTLENESFSEEVERKDEVGSVGVGGKENESEGSEYGSDSADEGLKSNE